ncbi:LysR family transcriptional regulator [Aidingimonas halophila]|uniref:LysR family transcriptional regulator n=1 Tax=Aidingimonas halophila TaxID=574349 RepID=UPI001E3B152F|nr:LysR family transcriptional regulator [Aidingimonas halophila]
MGIPKSKLSRRIIQLEERLATRLINRSTRHFAVTELGQAYYRHCVAMLVEAEAAEELIERNHAEPRGCVLHAVFPSRRGLLPAVRAFLDFLGENIADDDFLTLQQKRGCP